MDSELKNISELEVLGDKENRNFLESQQLKLNKRVF